MMMMMIIRVLLGVLLDGGGLAEGVVSIQHAVCGDGVTAVVRG